jgi:hypothetical protein
VKKTSKPDSGDAPDLSAHYLAAAKQAAEHLWQSIHHLNNAIESLSKVALLSGTREMLSSHFDSLSSAHARMKIWIEANDRQLEIPESNS